MENNSPNNDVRVCESCGLVLPSKAQDRLCARCLDSDELKEGPDFIIENGLLVFTREYLLKRGYCCGNGCRFCPYQ